MRSCKDSVNAIVETADDIRPGLTVTMVDNGFRAEYTFPNEGITIPNYITLEGDYIQASIAVDEITEAADILAMTAAANCGVKLLATIHAEDGEELRRKPLFRQLAEAGVFRRLITISTADGRRHYRTEAL